MTTLAYRDGVLASDSKATRGEMVVDLTVKKVRRLKDGSLVGITGMPAPAIPFIEWLDGGAHGQSPSLGSNSCVVHLRKNGSLRVYEDGGWTDEDPTKAWAWGSGWQIATTAMLCGKTAEQAVKMAITMDIWSGGKVIAIPLRQKALTQRKANAIVRYYKRK